MSAELMRIAMVGAEDLQARSMFEVLKEGGYAPAQIAPLAGTLGALEISLADDDTAEVLLPLTHELVEGTQVVALFSADPQARSEVHRWAAEGGQFLFDLAPVWGECSRLVDPLAVGEGGHPSGECLIPDPGALYLARLLGHLGALAEGPLWVQALLPASRFGEQGVRELFAQATSIMTFKPLPTEFLGRQTAFNCWPLDQTGASEGFANQVRTLSRKPDLKVAWSAVQSGLFHCTAVSAVVGTGASSGTAEALTAAIEADDVFGLWDGEGWPSPVDLAGQLKPVACCRMLDDETLFIWLVFDNAKAGKGALAGRMILGGGAG